MPESPRPPKQQLTTERRLLIAQERLRDVERAKLLLQLAPTATDAILDVGCSTGRLIQQLRVGGVNDVWGVDPDPALASPEAHIVTASATDLASFPDGRFTKIIYAHSMEHVADRPAALAEANRVLGDNGELHVTLFLYDDRTYQLPEIRAAAPELPPYLTQAEAIELITQAGFTIEHEAVLDQISSTQSKSEVPTLIIKAKKISAPA